MKKIILLSALLFVFVSTCTYADTGRWSTNWGGYAYTQSNVSGGVRHSTRVRCADSSGNCQAGSRTYTLGAGLPPYQITTTTVETDSWLIISSSQAHIHDHYGGWITR